MAEPTTTSDQAVSVPVPLWRNRPFALFWVAQLLSNTGTQVSELAVPLTAVLLLSATPVEMGVLTAMEALPSLVLGLFLGVLVDRVRRGRLLFWCNVGQGVLIGTIPVAALLGWLTLPQLYVVMFAVSGLGLAYGLAHTAYVPVLVGNSRQLTAANSGMAVSDSVTAVGGPGLGGVLVQALTAPIAVAVDAASFLIAAVLQRAGLRDDPRPAAVTPANPADPVGPAGLDAPAPPGKGLGRSLREGFRAFGGHRGVVTLTLAKAIPDFFHWGVLALFVLYAVRELHLSPATIGLIAMAGSLGPLLAGAIATPVSRRFGVPSTTVLATVLFGGANLLIPFASGPDWLVIATVAFAQFLGGLGVVYLIIVRVTMLQQSVEPHLLGRVGAVIRLVEWGPGPVGGIAGGLLGETLGLHGGLVVLGIGGLLAVPIVGYAAARGWLRTTGDQG
ncbi:MFS transporter [Flindersiella endophytica]